MGVWQDMTYGNTRVCADSGARDNDDLARLGDVTGDLVKEMWRLSRHVLRRHGV